MQFPGKITKADLADARDLTRPKRYWPGGTWSFWANLLLVVTFSMLFLTVQALRRGNQTNWWDVGLIWLGLAGAWVFVVRAAKKASGRQFAQLLASLPDRIGLSEQGVRFDGPGPDTYLRPWRDLGGWLEGRRVILLEWAEGGVPVILPAEQLSEASRHAARYFLRAHLRPPTGG
jgi:hypothetical protein